MTTIHAYTAEQNPQDAPHDPHASIVDGLLTCAMENTLVRVVSEYDNEWGYSNRCVDLPPAVLA